MENSPQNIRGYADIFLQCAALTASHFPICRRINIVFIIVAAVVATRKSKQPFRPADPRRQRI